MIQGWGVAWMWFRITELVERVICYGIQVKLRMKARQEYTVILRECLMLV